MSKLICIYNMYQKIRFFANPFIDLLFRLVVAYPFFNSGLTKFNYIQNNQLDTLYFLFQDYNVPLLSVEYAALLATFGELFLPILLVLGLATPIGALGLLIMTALIFNADQNPHAIYWTTILVYLLINGAGKLSLDSLLSKKLWGLINKFSQSFHDHKCHK
jgi:putative oxidoreductase